LVLSLVQIVFVQKMILNLAYKGIKGLVQVVFQFLPLGILVLEHLLVLLLFSALLHQMVLELDHDVFEYTFLVLVFK